MIAGTDRLTAESIGRRVARLKADLSGPHPTPLESLLVDQVVVSWLAANDGEIQAANATNLSLAQSAFRLRRAESGRRRLLQVVKTLAARGLVPLNSVRLFTPVAHRQRPGEHEGVLKSLTCSPANRGPPRPCESALDPHDRPAIPPPAPG